MLSTDFNFMFTGKMQATTLEPNLASQIVIESTSQSSNYTAGQNFTGDNFIFIVENMNEHSYSTLINIIDENENENRTFRKSFIFRTSIIIENKKMKILTVFYILMDHALM